MKCLLFRKRLRKVSNLCQTILSMDLNQTKISLMWLSSYSISLRQYFSFSSFCQAGGNVKSSTNQSRLSCMELNETLNFFLSFSHTILLRVNVAMMASSSQGEQKICEYFFSTNTWNYFLMVILSCRISFIGLFLSQITSFDQTISMSLLSLIFTCSQWLICRVSLLLIFLRISGVSPVTSILMMREAFMIAVLSLQLIWLMSLILRRVQQGIMRQIHAQSSSGCSKNIILFTPERRQCGQAVGTEVCLPLLCSGELFILCILDESASLSFRGVDQRIKDMILIMYYLQFQIKSRLIEAKHQSYKTECLQFMLIHHASSFSVLPFQPAFLVLFSSNPVIMVGSIFPGPSEWHLMVPAAKAFIMKLHAQVTQSDEVSPERLGGSPLPIQPSISTSQRMDLFLKQAILPNRHDRLPLLRILVCEFVNDLLLVCCWPREQQLSAKRKDVDLLLRLDIGPWVSLSEPTTYVCLFFLLDYLLSLSD